MASTRVTLAGVEYDVPKMNIGQIERVTELGSAGRTILGTIRIAMERATPKVANFNALEPDTDEIAAAYKAILELGGIKSVPEKNVETPAPPPGEAS